MLQLTVNTGQTSFHRASGSLAVSEPLTAYRQLCQYVLWWSLIFGKKFRAYMRAPARVYMRVRGCACARMIFSFIFRRLRTSVRVIYVLEGKPLIYLKTLSFSPANLSFVSIIPSAAVLMYSFNFCLVSTISIATIADSFGFIGHNEDK